MSYLPYLYLFVYSSIQHILCCIFALFVFVLCTQCCQCLWITNSWLPCRLFLTFIYLVYPVLPVSLDYPFSVALSVVSGLSILGCPVGCLTFIYLVYPVLPVSLDYPFLVALSVVSNVYLACVPSVASVSGLPILGCPVGCL